MHKNFWQKGKGEIRELVLMNEKTLRKLRRIPVIRPGRRIIPNAMLYAHREADSESANFPHLKGFKRRKRTGVFRRWHKRGRVAVEYSLRDGKVNGLFREWWPTGRLDFEKVYDMGEPMLIRQFSRLTGRLIIEIVSDGCTTYQRFWDRNQQKWKEYFVIHDKDVSRKEYFSFLKRQKSIQ